MQCPYCGTRNSDKSWTCKKCGAVLNPDMKPEPGKSGEDFRAKNQDDEPDAAAQQAGEEGNAEGEKRYMTPGRILMSILIIGVIIVVAYGAYRGFLRQSGSEEEYIEEVEE